MKVLSNSTLVFSLLKVMVVGYLIVKPTGPGNFAKTLLRWEIYYGNKHKANIMQNDT